MSDAAREDRIADLIARRRAAPANAPVRVDADDPAPLSTVQLGLWTMSEMAGARHPRALRPVAARLRGPLDITVLEAALSALVARHEPFRTIYPLAGAEPVQRVLDPEPVTVAVVDVARASEVEQAQAVMAAMRAADQALVLVSTDVLFDATVVVQGPEDAVLVLALSHICFDGWSEAVFEADLTELYRAIAVGEQPALPDLPIRYQDYSRWERSEASEVDTDAQLRYWHDELAGIGQSPSLPPGLGADDISYDPVRVMLDPPELEAIRRLARDEKTTPFVVLLAAVEMLARDLSDAEDFLTLCPYAGRDRIETQNLIGCFINHLYLRSSVRGGQTGRDHVRAVRERVAAALANRGVPNRLVLDQFDGWKRRPRISHLSLQWRDFPDREPGGPTELSVETFAVPYEIAGLAIYATPIDGGVRIEMQFDRRRYTTTAVEGWAGRLRSQLAALCAAPDDQVAADPIRGSAPPAADLAPEPIEPVMVTVARQAKLRPDVVAVESPAGALTYAELWEASGRVASWLIDVGVAPGDRVLVSADRSAGHVVAFLGVLRAGAAVVPVHRAVPGERLVRIDQIAAPTAIISVGAAPAGFDGRPTLLVDEAGRLDGLGDEVMPLGRIATDAPDGRAYVFFTSGTTGLPTGVVGTHRGLAYCVSWLRGRVTMRPGMRVAGVTNPSFDVSLRELLLPLTAGATLVVCPQGTSPADVVPFLADRTIDLVHLTPSAGAAWLSESSDDLTLPDLRWMIFAGEPLTGSLVQRWRERAASARALNLYGPTETCMVKAAAEVTDSRGTDVLPVGRALPHTQLFVVDPESGLIVDEGQAGEVVIRTAIGTAELLGPDAQPAVVGIPRTDGVQVHRTGDLGRIDRTGDLVIAGRIDDQIKIDGLRIEPSEVAAALCSHPDVADAAVLTIDADAGPRLHAFVVSELAAGDLRRHAAAHLLAPAIPSTFTPVSAIPLTPNGKVDRHALLEPVAAPEPRPAQPAAGGAAEALGAIWADVLSVDTPGPDADFFAAGGSSLAAQRILTRTEKVFGVALTLEDLFDDPTFGGLLARIDDDFTDAGHAPPVAAHETEAEDLPLSFAQERMWVLDQLTPGTAAYLVYRGQSITGPLDVAAFEQAMTTIVGRHEVLRSRIVTDRGLPRLEVDPPEPFTVDLHDLRDLDPSVRSDEATRIQRVVTTTPFDLGHDRLVRAHLIRLSETGWRLFVIFHHAVMDGQSYGVFATELRETYAAAREGRNAALEPLEAQYVDFARLQRRQVDEGAFDKGLAHWERALAPPLPQGSIGATRPGDPEGPVVAIRSLDAGVVDDLRAAAADHRATPFMIGLAVMGALLADETGEDDVITTMIVADRSWAPARDLMGYFVNTIPVRLSTPASATFADAVKAARARVLEAFQHGDVPLDLILDAAGARAQGADELINAVEFDLAESNTSMVEFADDLEFGGVDRARIGAKFDFAILVRIDDDRPYLQVKARETVLEQADVERLADTYLATLRRAIADPDTPIRGEPAPPPAVHVAPIPSGLRPLLDALRTGAASDPDRVILEDDTRCWTAAQFLDAVGGIAAQLDLAGVQHGDLVAIDATRCLETIAAMYGAWWVGAAYVPIDLDAPTARNAAIAADAAPKVVVSTRNDCELPGIPTVVIAGHVGSDQTPPPVAVTPDDPAYVIYTSGSTGNPKGVVVGHGAVAAFVDGAHEAYGLTADDRMLQFHSLAFDASVEEVHAPLALGATVVLRPDDLLGSARRLFQFVEDRQLSIVSIPTALWHELVPQLSSAGVTPPVSLTRLIIGGQAARPEVLADWLTTAPDVRLINSYGPTETTVVVTTAELVRAEVSDTVSIGRPLRHATVAVVDPHGTEVGAGDWGELAVSGTQLALGYLNDDAATAAAFFSRAGTRWYRTGDRARVRPDGGIEVKGRLDDQVKIDGHRIELEEVESALLAVPGVSAAAVVVTDTATGPGLHAFVVTSVDETTIVSALRASLPAPMIPSSITVVEELPTATSGKVDRAQLRALLEAPAVPEPPTAELSAAVTGGSVGRLVGLWSELLGVGGVDVGSDFFELGGRSLTAVRLAYLIEEEFGVELPVAEIFEAPTVGEMAAAIDALLGVEPDVGVDAPPTPEPAVSDPVPAAEPEPEVTPGSVDRLVAGGGSVGRLVGLWSELLGVGGVDVGSDFFELGGRSLTAVRLAYLIEEEFGVELPVAEIFEAPTVGEMAAAIDALLGVEPDVGVAAPPTPEPAVSDPVPAAEPEPAPSEPIEPSPQSDGRRGRGWPHTPVRLRLPTAPLSYAQERLWLHGQLRGDELPYLVPTRFRIRGPLDRDAFARAIRALVDRHEILRTRFPVGADGRPAQVVDPTPGEVLEVVSLDNVAPSERRDRAEALVQDHSRLPIPVEAAHPFRALLVRAGDTDHYVSVVLHHLASDDRTTGLLFSDLGALYAAELGRAPVPPEPELQFTDYAVWQRAQATDGTHDRAIAYWREALGPEPRAIELPGRFPATGAEGEIWSHDVELSPAASAALFDAARTAGSSPFQLLVALAASTFHRLTAITNVVIGTPRSERGAPELDDMIGLFSATMPIAVAVDPDQPFVELLQRVRAATGSAIAHGNVPFETLIDGLSLPREIGRMPLISVICQYFESGAGTALQLADVEAERLPSIDGRAGIITDLMITGEQTSDGSLLISFRHDTAALDPWVIGHVLRVMEYVANQVAAAPDLPVGSLRLVTPEDERWAVDHLNPEPTTFPAETRVETSFRTVAAERPHAIAVSDGRRDLTYADLDDRSDQLANELIAAGVSPGRVVAVEMDRSIELVVALLGVLKAGAVYLPIDAAAPARRRETVLESAGAVGLVRADGERIVIDVAPRPEVPLPEGDDTAAYVMFTSGSTGQPKGTVVGHRAIQRTVQGVDYAPLGPETVMGMVSNPAFDALTFEVWGAILNGGRVEVVDRDTLGDPAAFAAVLRERAISTMFLTSSLANLVAAAQPDAFTEMNTLLVGGEALDVGTMRNLVARGPERLVNGYGPTECTTFSATHLIESVPDDAGSIPIGRATTNTQLFVIDDAGAIVPPGIEGELAIAGPGLSMGYIGDPTLTAARFGDIVVAGRATRVYRTGDRVRRLPDGTIDFLGRADQQVKLRGFRIELGEIEAALLAVPSVDVAAVAVVGSGAARSLVAFVGSGDGVTEAAIRAELIARVPSYMVPARFDIRDRLPLTDSGKIDRMQLLRDHEHLADAPAAASPSPAIVPDDPQLARMLDLWRATLGTDDVRPTSDFFGLGGNSLLAVELLTKIEQQHGVRVRLSVLFEARTPQDLLSVVAGSGSHGLTKTRYLVQLSTGDDGEPPLWLVHPAGGSLVLYEPMVSHFTRSRTVVGVEAPGLDGTERALEDVLDFARHQLDTIRRYQPEGPYRILGYSIGGVIALEVARGLIEGGAEVEFLGAIEAGVPLPPEPEPTRRQKYTDMVRNRDLKAVVQEVSASIKERAGHAALVASQLGSIAAAHREVTEAMARAFHAYVPRSVPTDMLLFFGDDTPPDVVERLRHRWAELATEGVGVRTAGGSHDHDSILREPHAKSLAVAVEAELDRLDRNR